MGGSRRSRNAHRRNNPMGILGGPVQAGGNCVGWWDWQLATGPGVTITAVPNRAGNGGFAQTSVTPNPRTTLLGRQASKSTYDAGGNFNEHMKAVLIANVPAGNRPFMWCVSRLHATPTVVSYIVTGTQSAEINSISGARCAPPNFTYVANSAASEVITGAALDLLPHLHGACSTAATTAKAEMDGALYNGATTGATAVALDRVLAHINPGGGGGISVELCDALCSKIEPTSDQRRAIRDYYRRTVRGLSIL